MEDSPTDVFMSALRELREQDVRDVMAHLLATVYELSLRLEVQPRTVVNTAFETVASDEVWRAKLKPALRAKLETN